MSDARARLQKLLDGEMDPSEIAKDPTLASLAERIYGMDIKALLAEKGISSEGPDIQENLPPESSNSGLLIEVVPESAPSVSGLPPPAPIPTSAQTGSRNSLLILAGGLILIVSVFNLFIGIGELFNPCTTDWCSNNSKLIWLAPHQISNDAGWSASGVPGIPDFAMIGGSVVLLLLGLRKKA